VTTRPLRSLLFVPADSEKKLAKVATCGADAVILDLEDAVAEANKPLARKLAAQFLAQHPPGARPCQVWIRVNPFDTGLTLADLAAVVPGAPDGIIQPKTDGPDDVRRLSHYLDALEAAHGLAPGSIRIIPVATETPLGALALGDFAKVPLPRLAGLTWGAEDLSTALNASTNRARDGQWADAYRLVRSLCLIAGHAAGVPVYDTLHADFRDEAGLAESSRAARGEGFAGRLAIHPAQVAPINAAFAPSAEELAHARAVLAAFAANPDAGTVGLNGKMLDVPHRKQAKRIVAEARAFGIF